MLVNLITSLAIILQLIQASDPFSPRNLTVEDFTKTMIRLSWLMPVDGVLPAPETTRDTSPDMHFQIWYWPVNASMNLTMASTTDYNYTISGLSPGRMYSIWLLGIQGNLTSDYVTLHQRTGRSSPTWASNYVKVWYSDQLVIEHRQYSCYAYCKELV